MTLQAYQAALLRLYREQPDTPDRPRRSDWAIATDLYRQGVPFDLLAHAIRVAALRRATASNTHPPITSLAYYRAVLRNLPEDALQPDYRRYVAHRYSQLHPTDQKPRPDRQNPALSGRR